VDQTPERTLDEYLVVLSQAGSIEALDGLARRWMPRLLGYAARVLGGSSEAADAARDVVQDTWIGVIRGLRGLRDPRGSRRRSTGSPRASARTQSGRPSDEGGLRKMARSVVRDKRQVWRLRIRSISRRLSEG
jgi:sigma-70-like protein